MLTDEDWFKNQKRIKELRSEIKILKGQKKLNKNRYKNGIVNLENFNFSRNFAIKYINEKACELQKLLQTIGDDLIFFNSLDSFG